MFKQKILLKSKVNCFHKIKEEKKVLDLALILQKSKTFLNLYFDKSFYEKFLQPFGMLLRLACISFKYAVLTCIFCTAFALILVDYLN